MNSEYLNDLIRDLWLSKAKSVKLINSLNEFDIVDDDVNIERGQIFHRFYSNYANIITYCNDVQGLIEILTKEYQPNDWFLFLDASESSLKGCLCHSSKDPKYPEIPVLFSTVFDENDFNIALCLDKLNYKEHNWYIFGDLKSIAFITGLENASNELCFVCDFDGIDSKIRINQEYGLKIYYPNGYLKYHDKYLVDFKRIMLHPSIIKINIMKQFIKKLVKTNQEAFHYLVHLFNNLSPDKIKTTELFDITHLYRLNDNSKSFEDHLNSREKEAWRSLRYVSNNLFENYKNYQFRDELRKLFYNFDEMGCKMSTYLHFLNNHLNIYSQFDFNFTNLQCERFHKVINFLKKNYNPIWNKEIICDYIWCTCKESDYEYTQTNRDLLPRKFFRLN